MINEDSPDQVEIPIHDKNYHLNTPFHPYIRAFAEKCSGTVLDIGCGTKPHREWFGGIDEYIGVDISSKGKSVDVLGSGIELPIQSESADYVISTQVLEHLPQPFDFFDEVSRVLKPGGYAFISTNQMYPLHEKPNDYFRFTRYGLRSLAKSAGLAVSEEIESGNLLTRLCCEFNYLVEPKAPFPISNIIISIFNLIMSPIVRLNPREDYIVTAVVVNKPQRHRMTTC